jgi:hypothetical protein
VIININTNIIIINNKVSAGLKAKVEAGAAPQKFVTILR